MKKLTVNSIFNIIFFQLSIKVSKKDIDSALKKYYYSPSIEEITGMLNSWNINNLVINNIPIKDLNNAPLPILTFNKENELFVISNIKGDNFKCFFQDSKKEIILNADGLLKSTNGVYILLEADENSGTINAEEKDEKIKKQINAEKLILIGFTLIVFFGFNKVLQNGLDIYTLSFFGLILSVYLLLKEYSFFTQLLDVCKIGKKFNCDNVIMSQQSKLFGFSLSEISTGFFLFLILNVMYSNIINISLNNIAVFIYPSIMSVIYSFYQQLKIKQYCIVCIAISIVLILLISFSIVNYGLNVNFFNIFYSVFPFSITLLIMGLIKNYLFFYERFRKNNLHISSLLDSTLLTNSFKDIRIENKAFAHEIQIGLQGANYEMVLFMNPTCSKCKVMLKNLVRLFSEFENQVYLRILYSGPQEDDKYAKLMFAELYENLALLGDDEKINFLKNINNTEFHHNKSFNNQTLDSFTNQYIWSNELSLEGTPAIILNNVILPSFFGIEEICIILRKLL